MQQVMDILLDDRIWYVKNHAIFQQTFKDR